jgi:lysophospholipase L1-like esterase
MACVAGLLTAGALVLLGGPAGAQTVRRYVAFGDSITQGFADDPNRVEKGYPPRLESLLNTRGVPADVINEGLGGETTAEGLIRLESVLQRDAGSNVFLLMEGTNDINARISNETIVFNLDQMADRAEGAGMEAVHATIIPRLPSAQYDGLNIVTGDLNQRIRELAYQSGRKLADPFEVFFNQTPNVFTTLYAGGDDKLHPNAAGYDVIAQIFADVLTNVDSVPPVLGQTSPRNDQNGVSPTTPISIDLYDFGAGIDLPQTRLLINNVAVDTPIQGNSRKLEIRYTPPTPLVGVVFVGLRTRDLATPPHIIDRTLFQFIVAGTQFLTGDIDRDGRVDGRDLVILARVFGSNSGQTRYLGVADLNRDGLIDGADLSALAANFGRSSF